MGKIAITDIARILTERNGLSASEAEAFVNDIFDTIKNGLETDSQAKIKGLGTFKIIDVEARASVSVNTGERVVIDGHGKVTFTPDTTMKELVNKPFSQFETVVLNEGVNFDDIDDTPVEEPSVSEVLSVDELPVEPAEETEAESESVEIQSEISETVQECVSEPMPELAELTAEETVEETEVESEKPEEEDVETDEEEPDETDTENTGGAWKWVLFGLLSLILILAALYGGYEYGRMSNESHDETVVIDTASLSKTAVTDTVKADSVLRDTTAVVAKDSVSVNKTDTLATATDKPDYLKYNDMDVRLRTGAYYIMGTQREVKARKGQTLNWISKHWLGDGLLCYVEVYNGLTRNDTLQDGQTIKIPKLVWKSNVRKHKRVK